MGICKRGQVTIPKTLRDRFRMKPNVVDRIYGIVTPGGCTDEYVEKI